jgi:hypothetical protein
MRPGTFSVARVADCPSGHHDLQPRDLPALTLTPQLFFLRSNLELIAYFISRSDRVAPWKPRAMG